MALNDISKIMSKSFARSRIIGGKPPSTTSPIKFEEICCVCDKEIPDGKLVIRHKKSENIICLFCLVGLAEVE